jgi:predicted membrane protein
MENTVDSKSSPDPNQPTGNPNRNPGNNRVWVALAFVVIGGAMFLRQLGILNTDWLFTWQMLLIVIGVFMGFSHGFRGGSWLILILIGFVFLLDDIIPGSSLHRYAWPAIIIAIGLVMLMRPRHHSGWSNHDWDAKWRYKQRWRERFEHAFPPVQEGGTKDSSEDFFDSTSVFGGVKKIVLSKNFRGADITCFMGGCELDLTQADFQNRAVIDITQVFGGTKLIVPSHWKLSTEMTAFFGSIEDKRQQPASATTDKILVIQGTSVFGGIEIRNY